MASIIEISCFLLNPKQECDFLGPRGDAFTFVSTSLSRKVSPQCMNRLHFKRVFKNPNFFVSPTKLPR